MKKIILFICLLAGINVQGQILGGYVTNSVLTNSYVPYSGATKSVNLGSQILKTTGASTIGSLYVPGAITATNAITSPTLYGSSSANGTLNILSTSSNTLGTINVGGSSGVLNLNSGTITIQNKARVGSTTAPSATLDVTGTMSVSSTATITGQAKLTATNNILGLSTISTQSTVTLTTPASSGTLANLGDIEYPLNFMAISGSPADATTYYFSTIPFAWTAIDTKAEIPHNATIINWQAQFWVNGTTATTEASTLILVVNSSTTALNSSITMTNSGANNYTNTISQSITANDQVNFRLITPTWATNPTNVGVSIIIWVRRRQ